MIRLLEAILCATTLRLDPFNGLSETLCEQLPRVICAELLAIDFKGSRLAAALVGLLANVD